MPGEKEGVWCLGKLGLSPGDEDGRVVVRVRKARRVRWVLGNYILRIGGTCREVDEEVDR